MTVVLDSNVWVSALEFGGTPGIALTQALTIDQVAISDFIEREVTRVLAEKFGRDAGELQATLEELLRGVRRVKVRGRIAGVCRDANDIMVAGDRDLLKLKIYEGIGIITRADYVRLASEVELNWLRRAVDLFKSRVPQSNW